MEKIIKEIEVSETCVTSINELHEANKNSLSNIKDNEAYILSRENKIENMKKETKNGEG